MTTTTKTTKNTKTSKTTKSKQTAKQHQTAVENNLTLSLDGMRELTNQGIRLGLGLGAFLYGPYSLGKLKGDLRADIKTVVTNVIKHGEQVEKQAVQVWCEFQANPRKPVTEFITAREQDLTRTKTFINDNVQNLVGKWPLPTHSEIAKLNERLDKVAKELAQQRKESQSETITKPRSRAKRTQTTQPVVV